MIPFPTRALLLAGGVGSRLRPITDSIPKCLVPIGGRPLLYRWLDLLFSVEVKRVLINTHYLSEHVIEACHNSVWARYVDTKFEPSLLGTAKTLILHKDFFQSDSFWLIHADNLSIFDPRAFVDAFVNRPTHCIGTMMTFECEDPKSCGIVKCDSNGVISEYYHKQASLNGTLANAAVFIFSPAVFEFMDAHPTALDFCSDVVPQLIGKLNTFKNTEYHRDIGTPSSYNQALQDFGS
jgi:mannose-1-phosphate guanylyltransferase